MQDLKDRIKQLSSDFENIKDSLNVDSKKARVMELEAQSTDPGLWNDQDNARRVMQELSDTKSEIESINSLYDQISLLNEFIKEDELPSDLKIELEKSEKSLQRIKLTTFLSGKYDKKNATMSIHAGQGGTEAMDWTGMLFRMYMRFFENKGWKMDIVDQTDGEEAGIKSITLRIEGNYAYGYLKGEAGTHRLVRQSPFNADKLRQTSFAMVEVLPEFEEMDLPDLEIKDEDLEIQFFRSGGHGGQNVNKVSTAVRLKHIPTGVVVTAQTERFQEQNRKIAMGLLKSKLWALEQEKQIQEKKEVSGEYRPASWGNQIRSYVLHPYKMVKDLRTEVESSNPDSILDGEIDEFIEAELKLGK
ncbi:peptide chain release factor 2 [Candidatus Microgenomates bacterium]|nr:peptide chain release factor 2 [Candidatus Microgenomates bacterium]